MLKTILKNSLSIFSSQIIARFIGFVVVIVLSRYLGVEKFGQYSFVLAFVALFSITADLGISQLVIREVAKDKSQSQKYLVNFFIIQLFLSFINFLLIAVLINFLGYESGTRGLVYIAGLGAIALSLGMPFSSLLNAYEKMHYGAIVNITTTAINGLMALALIFLKQGLVLIIGSIALANVLNTILVYKFYGKLKILRFRLRELKPRVDMVLIKNLLKLSIPFALLMGFSTVYNRVDMTMLSKMRGDAAVGYYSAAYRIINFLSFIPIAFSTALFPVLSRLGQGESERENNFPFFINKSLKYIIAVGLPVVAGTSILAEPIIKLLYGREYLAAGGALRILVWMVAALCFYSVVTYALVAMGRVMVFALANGVGVVINIGLNLIFIPRWGFIGASITTVISELALLIISYYLAHRYIKYNEPFLAILKIALATLIVSVTMIILKISGMYFIFNIILAVILYLILLWIFKFISDDEKPIFNKLIYPAL